MSLTPYALFRAEVVRTRQLTPHLRRITFGGPELADMVSAGLDQRIKLFFPLPGQDEPVVPRGENWYGEYRAMAEHERPFMRTYTIRHFRPAERELDVDIVLHGDTGPGSTWAGRATAGDRVAILAPDARHTPIVGYECKPPADTDWMLLAGDDTALPAITAIVESLPAGRGALVFLEVDSLAEMTPMDSAADVRLTWLSRGGRPAVGSADKAGLLRETIARTAFPDGKPYAWLAGESSAITDLRRHLVNERGVDKELIYFSGYWLLGSPIE
ncbi:siderophore-interacting protein [Actinophytocola sp.]|uniref:siderophore-interacting protein n=1 Tax=Actinophytocola sp. TaxID=1872138 RepID=UPI0025C3999E|nr:siderophore-interacting protein [Actinophytocola sp.]